MSAGYHGSTAASHARSRMKPVTRVAPKARAGIIVLAWLCALLAGVLVPQVAKAAVLSSVQNGSAVITNGTSITTVPITSVDLSKSFLTFSVRLDNGSPADGQISGQITAANTLTFRRIGTSTNVTIEWSVAEFVSAPYPNHLLTQRNLFNAVEDPLVRLIHF